MKNINKKSINNDIISRAYINKIQQRNEMKQMMIWSIQAIMLGAAMILFIDAMFFMAWIVSGQTPGDEFYFGALTANLLKIII